MTVHEDRRLRLPIPLLPTVSGLIGIAGQRPKNPVTTGKKGHLKTSALGSTTILVAPAGILPAAQHHHPSQPIRVYPRNPRFIPGRYPSVFVHRPFGILLQKHALEHNLHTQQPQ